MYLPWEGLGLTALFTLSGLLLMFVGLLIFDWIVPYKLFQEVENGNEAAGWVAAGFLISTGIVLGAAFRDNLGWVQGIAYAILGIVLNILGYFAWEWLTPRWSLNGAVQKGTKSVGLACFGIFVALGLVIVGCFSY
jgi:putative membrane protein